MGCKASKNAPHDDAKAPSSLSSPTALRGSPSLDGGNTQALISSRISPQRPDRLYKLLARALHVATPGQTPPSPTPEGASAAAARDDARTAERQALYSTAAEHLRAEPGAARWKNPTTLSTPLHLACRLVDVDQNLRSARELCLVLDALLQIYPQALLQKDAAGNIPLHYAIAPTTHFAGGMGGAVVAATVAPGASSEAATAASPATLSPPQQQQDWRARSVFVQRIVQADVAVARAYWQQNDVVYESGDATGGCSPLYRVLQTLPDDVDPSGPTVDYVRTLQAMAAGAAPLGNGKGGSTNDDMAGVGNASDGDKPLSLLYRRFTRQFDISEMFFAGDNSRPEVVQHRNQYKCAAGNTWKVIECLLRRPPPGSTPPPSASAASASFSPSSSSASWGIVHRAVQLETPPDLLRYIVETNAQDLTRADIAGNLPLHYAAMVKPPHLGGATSPSSSSPVGAATTAAASASGHFPAFYTKYVVDELLYKFPEAAAMENGDGMYPLTLAITSGKQWIGGGIKSLYDAYPQALSQIDLRQHSSLQRALSMAAMGGDNADADGREEYKETGPTSGEGTLLPASPGDDDDNDDESADMDSPTSRAGRTSAALTKRGIIKDEHHDAIMLVQQPNVDISEVTTSMWAHEEDAGVQMLGCCAISKLLEGPDAKDNPPQILRIALTATASVVNAMKAHPNEVIVQEKACAALRLLAPADGRREVSMVASGAVAAVVAAMQAHVGDARVQEEACGAIAAIVRKGGGDRATVVASVSGVTAILNAVAAHPHVAAVQVEGCHALLAMTDFDATAASLPELPKTQTEPLLWQAKEDFPQQCGDLVDRLMARMG